MNCPNQPPCLNPCSPLGSSTTPSSETFSLTTIFPILNLLAWTCVAAWVEAFAGEKIERRISGRADVITVMLVKGTVGARMRVTNPVLARARAGEEYAFRELTDPYRRELQVH